MKFKSCDQKTIIYGKIWYPEIKPKGIIHGITEHIGRYEQFARYFINEGFIVFGIDLIGHGRSLCHGKTKGYFRNDGSWQNAVDDVYRSYLMIKKKYPKLPYFIVGFSLGSFIVRTLLIQKQVQLKWDGYFLLGTSFQSLALIKVIKWLVKNTVTELAKKIQANYNKKYKHPETNVDWLLY